MQSVNLSLFCNVVQRLKCSKGEASTQIWFSLKTMITVFMFFTGSPQRMTSHITTVWNDRRLPKNYLQTVFKITIPASLRNQVIAFWVLGNWLIFTAICSMNMIWDVFVSFQCLLLVSSLKWPLVKIDSVNDYRVCLTTVAKKSQKGPVTRCHSLHQWRMYVKDYLYLYTGICVYEQLLYIK